jgi:hypothetical protein
MAKLQMSVAQCADEAPAAESRPPSAGGPRTGTRGRTVLTLELEKLDGQLRIADAHLGNGEAAGDWRVECAQRKLRGQVIPAPVSRGGDRMRVPFVLKL